MANFTSFEVTARFTGGLNLTFGRILTVTVFWSAEISGSEAARSGTASVKSSGLNEYSVRCVAYTTM